MKKNIFGLTLSEFEKLFVELNEPSFRAKQLCEWLYQKNVLDVDLMSNVSKSLKEKIKETFTIEMPQIHKISESQIDNSYKFLFKTHDEQFIESVLMLQEDRATVCVSCMIGCPLKCAFCATGSDLRFVRNLDAGEILGQILTIQNFIKEKNLAKKITNIVYMGMGEPLLNFINVEKSIEILISQWGFQFPHTKITVSTAGITDKIAKLIEKFRVRVAVSLHFIDDTKRSQFMPINQKYPLGELVATLRRIELSKRDFITIEYIMIKDVNDTFLDAQKLGYLLSGIQVKINLIPLNPTKSFNHEPSTEEQIDKFIKYLWSKGFVTTVRRSKGKDVSGACGQLALKNK
ncbi:TPA: 23S rRNA (adenine(2503)-C(2))-methyltransferase RlmN [Candidatus Dependentiae bacterium]|nr:MAG: putative dual-specificity RNA methyltransferase RlmN [candidate division TM6 bacterium GW2011_GWE2_31_21]KKP53260.1 MAG: putative dual-specificity RNA methyltransferase RlmN [candidate division TM6 bacterium GW2011_GWF2_33_332]HBS48041.1 23S rRNA (adenine(2503)-C(2))-methyltransferase RlmN [Candidatus Dependentiae bacterium]HBZ73356.1 23S rRNA (adenine(2503)-C(2))-methyltransferase RlmN [Candidatus Dependentiae bacterium]